jgi:deoxyribodipyrimidine photo-lyase
MQMNSTYSTTLVWLRRDLRLYDNRALAHAERASDRIAVCFVFDTNILNLVRDRDDRRITFIHDSLKELDSSLRSRGSFLVVRYGDAKKQIPELAQALNAQAVFTNHDYGRYAKGRDEEVRKHLGREGIAFESFKDQVIFERDEIVNSKGEPYKVFSPYKKAWLAKLYGTDTAPELEEELVTCKKFVSGQGLVPHIHPWDLDDLGFKRAELWLAPGTKAGKKRLNTFIKVMDSYKDKRDFPALDATSGMSVHLRFGTVSIRECFREAMKRDSAGARTWISELIWREFYQMILDRFPYVKNAAFKQKYKDLKWEGSEQHFRAWREGYTGYPLIDAAMRHFNKTGWMHNRLRMVVAMFLTKDLLIDWRKGERYFARYLLDYDTASNNGGWQWSASTGVDAQPYFRVFNPVLQSKRFDPEAAYIRKHLPELHGYSNARIHWPVDASPAEQVRAGCIIGKDYPRPIVDHKEQKEKAIAMFMK